MFLHSHDNRLQDKFYYLSNWEKFIKGNKIGMANIISDENVVPELIQKNVNEKQYIRMEKDFNR